MAQGKGEDCCFGRNSERARISELAGEWQLAWILSRSLSTVQKRIAGAGNYPGLTLISAFAANRLCLIYSAATATPCIFQSLPTQAILQGGLAHQVRWHPEVYFSRANRFTAPTSHLWHGVWMKTLCLFWDLGGTAYHWIQNWLGAPAYRLFSLCCVMSWLSPTCPL